MLGPGPDWGRTAWMPHANWSIYIAGYERAAELIMLKVLEGVAYDRNTLVYPLLFNSRHIIELYLKCIRHDAQEYLDREVDPYTKHNHDIGRIWKQVRPLLDAMDWNYAGFAIAELEQVRERMAAVDKGSFAFRYPLEKDGKPSIDTEDTEEKKASRGLTSLSTGKVFEQATRALRHIYASVFSELEFKNQALAGAATEH